MEKMGIINLQKMGNKVINLPGRKIGRVKFKSPKNQTFFGKKPTQVPNVERKRKEL